MDTTGPGQADTEEQDGGNPELLWAWVPGPRLRRVPE